MSISEAHLQYCQPVISFVLIFAKYVYQRLAIIKNYISISFLKYTYTNSTPRIFHHHQKMPGPK
jgi:hypothetical protein